MDIKQTLKNRVFWGGFLTAIAGVVAGTLTLPEALIQLITLITGG